MDVALGTRHVACQSAFNVRDLGGYPTADGSRTRWGTVYRAAGLHRASAQDVDRLGGLGWRTVIDLRSFAEVEQGTFRCEGTEVVHLPVLSEVWDTMVIDHEADPVEYLVAGYLEMAAEGAVAFAAAFEILAAPGRRPAVFHCSAGKDRTGVLAALVLAAVGVDDHGIARDYALSAAAMQRIVDWYGRNAPGRADVMARQPEVLLACPADAMLKFLARLRERHGTVDEYLLTAGVPAAALARLRAQLVVG